MLVEFVFMFYSAETIMDEWYVGECMDADTEDRRQQSSDALKSSVLLLSAIHLYNVIRVCYKLYIRQKAKRQKANLLKCFLADCYGCIALFAFIWAQYCYFEFRHECQREMPLT